MNKKQLAMEKTYQSGSNTSCFDKTNLIEETSKNQNNLIGSFSKAVSVNELPVTDKSSKVDSTISSEKMESKTKKNYASIDLFKLIFLMLIIVLHVLTYALESLAVDGSAPTGADGGFLFKYVLPVGYSIIRLGVPFFFISSSFFLFKKIKQNPDNRKQIIIHYTKRILYLFLFWLVMWTPFLIIRYINSSLVWWQAMLEILYKTVLTGLFPTAWYLIASIYGTLFVNLLDRKKVSNLWIVIICSIIYVLPCMACSYFHLFDGTIFGEVLGQINSYVILYNSPLAGFVFIAIGKVLADKNEILFEAKDKIMLAISFVLLFTEIFLLNIFGITSGTDCLVLLPLTSYYFFKFVTNLKLKERPFYKTARQFSTFLYVSHCFILELIFVVLNALNINIFVGSYGLVPVLYLIILLSSFGLFCLFRKLSTKKYGKIFKVSF